MPLNPQTTSFSEAVSGDTSNPAVVLGGNASLGNWPLLGFDSSGKAVFSGAIASDTDQDFFVIDVAGGTHDWSGSLSASAGFTVTVQLTGGGGPLSIEGRREDYNYLATNGPYGASVFYKSDIDGANTITVSNSDWKSSGWSAAGVTSDFVLGFELQPYGYRGAYTITIQTNGGGSGALPDLTDTVTSLGASSVAVGSAIQVNHSLINQGSANVSGQKFAIYLSTDSTITTSDIFLGELTTGSIGGQTSQLYSTSSLPIPSNVVPGSYYVGVIADYNNAISESNEGNNASSGVAITITSNNRPPVAVNDTLTVTGTLAASKNVLLNDSDPDLNPLTLVGITQNPTKGTATFNAGGTITYTPKTSYSVSDLTSSGFLTDQLTYQVSDGHGGTATAKLNVMIDPTTWVIDFGNVTAATFPTNNPEPHSPGSLGPDDPYDLTDSLTVKFNLTSGYVELVNWLQQGNGVSKWVGGFSNVAPTLWLGVGSSNIDSGFGTNPRYMDNVFMPGSYELHLDPSTSTGLRDYISVWEPHPDQAGNNGTWAKNLGIVSGGATVSAADSVTRIDGSDYYKFTLTKPSAVAITLVTQSSFGNVHLYLDDADSLHLGGATTIPTGFTHYLNGGAQQFRDVQTTGNDVIALSAGTYYFSVEHPVHYEYDLFATPTDPFNREPENYKVFVTAWDDNAGNNPVNSRALGTIPNTTKTITDNVSIADPNDWYTFNVTDPSSVSISITPTNPNFTVGLEFARFNPLDLSILPGTNSFIAFAPLLPDGNAAPLGPNVQLDANTTYWVRAYARETYPLMDNITYDNPFVYPDNGNTDYTLTIKTTTIPPGSSPDITGDPGPNIILGGGTGASTIRGQGGGDTVYAGAGDDTVVGGPGNNIYDGGTDINTLDYSTAPSPVVVNLIAGSAQNGYGGIDTISYFQKATGTAGSDAFIGNSDDNVFDGKAGGDYMVGNAGNDVYFVDNVNDLVVEKLNEGNDLINASVTFSLPANVEALILTGTADIGVAGNADNNYLKGNSGNNTIDGKAGADYMVGGAGNDIYFVDNAGDAVVENINEGNDIVHASIDYTIGANIESLILDGSAINGAGNATGNAIIGNDANNIIDGRGGGDLMQGGKGNDIYFVDNAADSVVENSNEGNDIVHASIDYTIGANIESLILDGTTVNGGGNSTGNAIVGNDSNNIIDGKGGADLMQGGKGNDIYFVDNAGDSVIENANEGNDIVHATIDYTIGANIESLILDGTANLAGAGNSDGNAIVANSGDNILDGRGGQDYLIGNAGNDTFAFKSGEAGGDLVADFAGNGPAVGDNFLFIGFGSVAQGATFTEVGVTNQWQIHSGLDGHNEVITLQNNAVVHPSDYLFV